MVSSIRRKRTKLSNKSFMKYNYLTLFTFPKEGEGAISLIYDIILSSKALICKVRKQKIKNVKANIHARPCEREFYIYREFFIYIVLISTNILMSFVVEKRIK